MSAGKFMEQTRSCDQDGICWAAECSCMWEELQCHSLWLLKMPKDLPVAASSQSDPEGTYHTSTEPSIQLSPHKKVLAWFQIGHLAIRQLMPRVPLWIWSLTEKATMWTELPRTRGQHMNHETFVSYWQLTWPPSTDKSHNCRMAWISRDLNKLQLPPPPQTGPISHLMLAQAIQGPIQLLYTSIKVMSLKLLAIGSSMG